MEKLLDVTIIPFKEEYIPELAELLATAYMVTKLNNPFIEPLHLTKDEMVNEFDKSIKSGLYHIILVFADRVKLEQGQTEIVACWCWGDLVDFFPKGELNMETTNFDIVPTLAKVRLYMRYKSIKPIYEKFHPEKGQIAYSGNFCVKPTYQGRGLTYQLYFLGYQAMLKNYGYNKYIGHAINPIMQHSGKKSAYFSEEVTIDVSDMYVEETQGKPFQGLNLCQIVFPIDIEKTFQLLVDFFKQLSEKQKLQQQAQQQSEQT